MTLKRLQ